MFDNVIWFWLGGTTILSIVTFASAFSAPTFSKLLWVLIGWTGTAVVRLVWEYYRDE